MNLKQIKSWKMSTKFCLVFLVALAALASVESGTDEKSVKKDCNHERFALLLKRGVGCFGHCSTMCAKKKACKVACKNGSWVLVWVLVWVCTTQAI